MRGKAVQTKVLKFIVIFLAILILAGFTVIVLTIAHRLKHGDDQGGGGASAKSGVANLELPAQSKVLDMVGAGGNRMAIRIEGPDGNQSILLVDAASGKLIEMTHLVPAKIGP
ncbi:MAG TPA: hypothetical protein VL574_08290 [Stellaceae bacterium]|jgi:hypothetical protein|nr:hypothetical protein [Stellaceae bacterium]